MKYSGIASELMKIAAQRKGLELAKLLGGSALSFGVGTAAGMGIGHLADKAYKGLTGNVIPRNALLLSAPLLGAGAGIAYAMHKKKEQEAIRGVLEDPTDARGA